MQLPISDRVKKIFLGTSGLGAGAMLMYLLGQAIERDPALAGAVLHTLLNWGPLFFIAIAIIVVGDRRLGEIIETNRASATSQQALADAVRQLVEKDDREAEKQDRMLSYVGSQMEKLAEEFAELRGHITKGRAAHG